MPFITQSDRAKLDPTIYQLQEITFPLGAKAYAIYKIAIGRLAFDATTGTSPKRYHHLSTARAVIRDVLAVLDKEYMEYEEKKKNENGDI